MQTSGNETRPDAGLFTAMTAAELDAFCDSMTKLATRESCHGNYALAREFDEIWHDLDGAWWLKHTAGQL